MKNYVLSLAVLILTASSLCVAEPPEPIRLGSILILSGEGAATGTASRRGIDLAVEEINAGGGILGRPLEVSHQDDQGDPTKTLSAFRHLVDAQGIKFLIGPTWSNQGEAIVDIAARKDVLMISPSLGVAKFNEAGPRLFNTWPHDRTLSEALADYVYNKGHRSIALVSAEHVWVIEQTSAFRTRFEALGGEIAYFTEPLPGTTDLRADALRIQANKKIDALVSTTDGVIVGSLLAKELYEIGGRLPCYSITLDQAAIDAGGKGFDGLEFLTFLTPTPEFEAHFKKRFEAAVDIGADSAYDAVMMLKAAIEKASSIAPDEVATALSKITEYRGASGVLTADGKGGFSKPLAARKVQGGHVVAIRVE